jgi:ribosomal protein S18 acetylase RimI-like enzyme
VELRALVATDLPAVRELLGEALEWDPFAPRVAEEKLFGGDAGRPSLALGAFRGETLCGLAAAGGRWIKLLAVAPAVRRQGIGSALYEAIVAAAPGGPGARLRVADHPGNYLTPGVDPRYQEGLAFLRARGFVDAGEAPNLRVRLVGNRRTTRVHAERLAVPCEAAGYRLRRARADDRAALEAMVTAAFSRAQAWEVGRALEVGGVHLALGADGAVVAFAAHDGNNRGLGWFGPAGTLPEHRGRGLGEALLCHCLADVAERGQDETLVAWVGPVGFYRRAVGAEVERTFLQLERPAP